MYVLKKLNVVKITDDEVKKNRYIANGFELFTDEVEDPKIKRIKNMTVNELKAYAAENEIDLNGVTKKPDIINIILAFENAGDGNEEERED